MAAFPRLFLLLLALLGIAVSAAPAMAANRIAAQLVVAGPAQPGGTVMLALAMQPEPGWHGYWSNPGDAGLGMELAWGLPPGWQAGAPLYPVPQTYVLSGLMNHVYEHDYAVLVPLTLPAGAKAGSPVAATLDAIWLACKDVCIQERARLSVAVQVGGAGARDPRFDAWQAALPPLIDRHGSFESTGGKLRLQLPLPAAMAVPAPHLFIDQDKLIDYAAPQTFRRDGDRLVVEMSLKPAAADAPAGLSGILKLDDAGNGVRFQAEPGEVASGGTLLAGPDRAEPLALWALLALAMAGGLLLNVMPCVFPILSLKALSLARAGESEAEARAEGLAYTGGVLTACLALGALLLALRAGGAELGWAFQLQEPGVVVALLLLATVITANLAGLFELPSLSVTRSGQPMGAFATGLLAAFVATPCTGPFMATAMGAALLLPPVEGMAIFAALGLGLALPFLALGFIPPLRRLLPRPGAWMNTFRHVLAVPMGLTALALLWLAWRLGGDGFALLCALLLGLLIACLVLMGRRQRRGEAAGRLLLGGLMVIAVAAVAVLPAAFSPPAAGASGVVAARPFTQAELDRARASGKPVFVWFTADWCLTCKVNEGVAIEREATAKAFERAGVIAIKGDWTRRDPEITRFLTAQGAAGVPLYLWYAPGKEGQQLPQVLGPDSLVSLAEASR